MSEEKQEFKRTKELSVEEVKEIISTEFGVQLKLNDVKTGHHIIMKIVGPVKETEYETAGDGEEEATINKVYRLPCKYKPKGCEAFELDVQVGENAVKRLLEKFPKEKYVGMYSYFSRTSYQGKSPQFVNPIEHYTEPVDMKDLFKPAEGSEGKKVNEGTELVEGVEPKNSDTQINSEEFQIPAEVKKIIEDINVMLKNGKLKPEDVTQDNLAETLKGKEIVLTERQLELAFKEIKK